MAKCKLKKYAQIEDFANVFQINTAIPKGDFSLKSKWAMDYFKNQNPIVVELGCGKGEYTLALAKQNPDINFIGIDIKGDRIWRGAQNAIQQNLINIAFLRIQIEWIELFFAQNEISEIWITFPDPQPNKPKIHKRLTSPNFLQRYTKICKENSQIHLKTDNKNLYYYTLEVIETFNLPVIHKTNDLYASALPDNILNIQTYYEQIFRNKGESICYVNFVLTHQNFLP